GGAAGAIIDSQATGIQYAVTDGNAATATQINLLVQSNRYSSSIIRARFGHGQIAVAVERHFAIRADVVAVAVGIGHVPAGIGSIRHIVDSIIEILELAFGRCLVRGDVVGVPGRVGQAVYGA